MADFDIFSFFDDNDFQFEDDITASTDNDVNMSTNFSLQPTSSSATMPAKPTRITSTAPSSSSSLLNGVATTSATISRKHVLDQATTADDDVDEDDDTMVMPQKTIRRAKPSGDSTATTTTTSANNLLQNSPKLITDYVNNGNMQKLAALLQEICEPDVEIKTVQRHEVGIVQVQEWFLNCFRDIPDILLILKNVQCNMERGVISYTMYVSGTKPFKNDPQYYNVKNTTIDPVLKAKAHAIEAAGGLFRMTGKANSQFVLNSTRTKVVSFIFKFKLLDIQDFPELTNP